MRSTLLAFVLAALVAIAVTPAGAQAASCTQSHLPLQDPYCQIGTTNPDVSQDNIDGTICVSGWTSTVRPPTSYTNPLKAQQIGEYGYSDTNPSDYEEDHLIPLELGGAPRDPQNLWPEPRYQTGGETASNKDTIENRLKTMVCNGQVSLDAARLAIACDWVDAISGAETLDAGGDPCPAYYWDAYYS
jgi:hypothetical protein